MSEKPKTDGKNDFIARSADRQGGGLVAEFWDFLKDNKKWWLAPIILVMLLLGALIVLSQGSAVAPFIYTLF